ncbi:MAG: TRZ/ATZ family hydrolase [Gammaproteobacteria bacterium]
MQKADCMILPQWIVPVEPEGVVLEDHALVIDAGRIVAVEPTADAQHNWKPGHLIERPGQALLPGFVNAHTHSPMSLFRGMADDMALEDWLGQHIWPAEVRWVSEDFVRDGVDLAMAEMLRGGTTCFADMYFFPDVIAQRAAEMGMRACVGMIVIDLETVWAKDFEEYLAKGIHVHDQYREHPLVSTMFAPHSTYMVSDANLEHVRTLADELDTPIQTHVHETPAEVAESVTKHGKRPLERLEQIGMLNPLLAAVHMTQLEQKEIGRLAEKGASVVHCPESNLKLASGFCPVAKLLEAGINVALGTDGAASNNDLDMLAETRTAALLAKGVAGDAAALSAAAALSMATINGARALGLSHETGSLLPGKWADLCCINLDVPATQPVYNPVSQIVYAASRDQVTDVWVAGEQLLAEGELVDADESEIIARAHAWQSRIAASDQ